MKALKLSKEPEDGLAKNSIQAFCFFASEDTKVKAVLAGKWKKKKNINVYGQLMIGQWLYAF